VARCIWETEVLPSCPQTVCFCCFRIGSSPRLWPDKERPARRNETTTRFLHRFWALQIWGVPAASQFGRSPPSIDMFVGSKSTRTASSGGSNRARYHVGVRFDSRAIELSVGVEYCSCQSSCRVRRGGPRRKKMVGCVSLPAAPPARREILLRFFLVGPINAPTAGLKVYVYPPPIQQ